MPKKYRKRPVVIEAMQFTGHNSTEIEGWFLGLGKCNEFAVVGIYPGNEGKIILINTLEGIMEALPGDYIIKGVKGEFYPCKPDIFAKTYEAVEE